MATCTAPLRSEVCRMHHYAPFSLVSRYASVVFHRRRQEHAGHLVATTCRDTLWPNEGRSNGVNRRGCPQPQSPTQTSRTDEVDHRSGTFLHSDATHKLTTVPLFSTRFAFAFVLPPPTQSLPPCPHASRPSLFVLLSFLFNLNRDNVSNHAHSYLPELQCLCTPGCLQHLQLQAEEGGAFYLVALTVT